MSQLSQPFGRGVNQLFPASWERDEPTLPMKGDESVYIGPESLQEGTVLHIP